MANRTKKKKRVRRKRPRAPRPEPPPTVEDHVASALRRAVRSALDRGESASSISRRAGVPQPCVSRMMSGARRGVSLSNARKLAAALGVDLGGIL